MSRPSSLLDFTMPSKTLQITLPTGSPNAFIQALQSSSGRVQRAALHANTIKLEFATTDAAARAYARIMATGTNSGLPAGMAPTTQYLSKFVLDEHDELLDIEAGRLSADDSLLAGKSS